MSWSSRCQALLCLCRGGKELAEGYALTRLTSFLAALMGFPGAPAKFARDGLLGEALLALAGLSAVEVGRTHLTGRRLYCPLPCPVLRPSRFRSLQHCPPPSCVGHAIPTSSATTCPHKPTPIRPHPSPTRPGRLVYSCQQCNWSTVLPFAIHVNP